jgi:dephospho-CoA kinase
VFDDPEELRWLEALLHPFVRRRMAGALRDAVVGGQVPAVVLDVPLLLESSPLGNYCDVLIFVDCDAALRRQRVQTLRGWSEEELDRRESHQWPPEHKRRAADVVFRNDGTEAELTAGVARWLERSGGFAGLPRREDLTTTDYSTLTEQLHESHQERPRPESSGP